MQDFLNKIADSEKGVTTIEKDSNVDLRIIVYIGEMTLGPVPKKKLA